MALFKVMKTKWIEVMIIVLALGLLSLCFATFDNTIPTDGDAFYTWPTSIRANWNALEAVLGVNLNVIWFFDIKTYGATEADAATGIQAAIDAAAAAGPGGGVVLVPSGTWNLGSTTINMKEGVTLKGSGKFASRLTSTATPIIQIDDQDTWIIKHLWINGDGTNKGIVSQNTCARYRIEQCYFTNLSLGISITNSWVINIYDNLFQSNVDVGINLWRSSTTGNVNIINIIDNDFEGGSAATEGIILGDNATDRDDHQVSRCNIRGNTIESYTNAGIRVDFVRNVSIEDNWLENNDYDVKCEYFFQQLKIGNNHLDTAGTDSLYIVPVATPAKSAVLSILDNYFTGNTNDFTIGANVIQLTRGRNYNFSNVTVNAAVLVSYLDEPSSGQSTTNTLPSTLGHYTCKVIFEEGSAVTVTEASFTEAAVTDTVEMTTSNKRLVPLAIRVTIDSTGTVTTHTRLRFMYLDGTTNVGEDLTTTNADENKVYGWVISNHSTGGTDFTNTLIANLSSNKMLTGVELQAYETGAGSSTVKLDVYGIAF